MIRRALVPLGICLWMMSTAGHPPVQVKSPHPGIVAFGAIAEPAAAARGESPPQVDSQRAQNVLAQRPLSFEENRGQAAPGVLYVARGAMYGVSLLRDGVTLTLPDRSDRTRAAAAARRSDDEARVASVDRPMTDISIRLAGSRPPARVEGLEARKARSHYYKGQDPSRWITDVPNVGRVRYESVYPGIDVHFYGNQRRLEFDFVLAPHARVSDIGLDLDGVEAMRLDAAGDLVLQVAGGELMQRKPVAFQERDGARVDIEARYVVDGHHVRLDIGAYDDTLPLVIDPVFDNSTYLGGANTDNVTAMAVDQFGQLHVAGFTQSGDFPTNAGGSIGPRGNTDVFLMRFSSTNELLTSTVLGSSVQDEVYSIAVDASGAAYLVGTTFGSGYPTTAGAFDETFNGGPDVFATKVAFSGQLVYSTYIGTTGEDHGRGAAVIPGTNELLIVGDTNNANFPRTMLPTHQGAFDVFLLRLPANGSSTGFVSRLIGGGSNDNAEGLAFRNIAGGSRIVVAGDTRSTNFIPIGVAAFDTSFNGVEDVFVAEFDPTSLALMVASFLGGTNEEKARGVAVLDNDTFVTGYTLSNDFPGGDGTRQGQDAFAARFGPNLATLAYGRVFTGSGDDVGYKIAAGHDPNGVNSNAYIVGDTTSPNFFTTFNALDPSRGGANDAFLVKLNAAGTTMYSSYLGGPGDDFARAVALQGTTVWVGGTTSGSFPIVGTPFDGSHNGLGDGYVARFTNFQDTNVTQQLLTVNRTGNGTVTSSPPGIDCGGDCLQAYPNSTVVTLSAVPANAIWTGCDGSSPGSCIVTMNAPKTVSVTFPSGPALPSITAMTPAAGNTHGNVPVTILGTNFIGVSDVSIGGSPVRNLVVEPTRLTFLTPPGSGSPSLSITTSSGTTTRTFTYVEPISQTVTNAARPAFSFDGRWMAFDSTASLVASDTNGLPDIFVRDRSTGAVVRVSVSSTGAQAIGGGSRRPSISATGRFVAFESAATNLVPADTNQAVDIFVVDRDPDGDGKFDELIAGHTSRTFRVNLGPPTTDQPNGAEALGGDSRAPSINGSGRWIAFDSAATNLVPGDTNQRRDVFVFDTRLGRTTRVSVSTTGEQAVNGDSTAADISLNGRAVAFQSGAANLVPGDTNGQLDVFLRDRDVDVDGLFDEANGVATVRVSVTTTGLQAEGGPSADPSITSDGQLIAFVSEATNLASGDTNSVSDIYLRDRSHGTTRRMSLDPSSGGQFVGASYAPAISANGKALIFSIANIETLSSNGTFVIAQQTGSDTGGTVMIPSNGDGGNSSDGTMETGEVGETKGESGVSGDGSTTGSTTEMPSGESQVDVDDNNSEQSAGGNDPPFIAEITPQAGPPGGGGMVDIVGNNFENNAVVHWGTLDLVTTVLDDGRARVQMPQGSGEVDVALRSNGEVSNDVTFTYRIGSSEPRITSVDPDTSFTDGGTPVTIVGTGFVPTNIVVRFRGRPAEVVLATPTMVQVKAPAQLEGPVPITLINEDGAEASSDEQFVYQPPPPAAPTIIGLSPNQGFREVTTVVTVTGGPRSFAPGTTATVDAVLAPVSYYSDTVIVVEVPPSPKTGIVQMVVTVPGAAGTGQKEFIYSPVPDPFGTSPDSDGDGMTDDFEKAFGLSPNDPSDATGDPDGDGLTNLQESMTRHHPVGLYTRYLAEGAANEFFDVRIAIANPNTSSATVLVHFQRDSASPTVTHFVVVPPQSRIHIDPALPPVSISAGSFATVVESNMEVVVDRTMWWDHSRYGAHAETSLASPATTWYLAEGATNNLFELFYLLQNPDLTRTADVRVRYIRSLGDPIEKTYQLAPQSRQTIRVNGEDPGLAFADISAVITSEGGVPIIVERAMYARFPGQRAFESGHDSAGVTAPSTEWFLAEGATGPFFEMFVLYANPTNADAAVETTYLMPDGSTIPKTIVIPANRRVTVQVASEDPRLVSATPSVRIKSTNGVPIIVERTMWWPRGGPWVEAHNAPGSTSTGTRWAVADGEVGAPPLNTQTFLLIANTSTFAGRVRVTLLFEDGGAPVTRDFDVLPQSRRTIPVGIDFPEANLRGFGAVIESLPDPGSGEAAQIVVERAMYSDTPQGFWGAGTNVLATKLK